MRGPYLYSSQWYWLLGSVSYVSGAEPVWLPPSMFLVILEANTALLCKRIITSLYPMMSLSSYPPWPHEDTAVTWVFCVLVKLARPSISYLRYLGQPTNCDWHIITSNEGNRQGECACSFQLWNPAVLVVAPVRFNSPSEIFQVSHLHKFPFFL